MDDERLPPVLLAAAGASLLVTAAVTVLSLTKTISPEWFFGAPVVGAGVTGVGVVGRAPNRLADRSKYAAGVVERLALVQRLLAAERLIELRLEQERDRILGVLDGDREESLVQHLGRDFLIHELKRIEDGRRQAVDEIGRFSRAEAVAYAELIGVAQERGIRRAHLLEPDELISAVVEETEVQAQEFPKGEGREPESSGHS